MAKKGKISLVGVVGHLAGRVGVVLTALLAIVMLMSAYGGYVDPRSTSKFAILNLGLPYLAILTMISAVVWLVLRQWRYALCR